MAAAVIEELLNLIGHPVILLLHSGVAPSGWMAADARPKLVKGIVAAEPVSPPIEEAERGRSGRGRLWGLTNLPVHYDPPIKDPSELRPRSPRKAGWAGPHPVLGSTGARAQARKHAGYPGSQCIGRGELSPSVLPLHSQVAQSGRCKDHVRQPRRCRAARQWPSDDVRKEQR